MSTLAESAACIAAIPLTMRQNPHLSPEAIVREAGARSYAPTAMAEAIRAHLVAQPELVMQWLGYSQDQRISSGWFLAEAEEGSGFTLGHYPESASRPSRLFPEAPEACAAFIVATFLSVAEPPAHLHARESTAT
jgi:hypothetical protein